MHILYVVMDVVSTDIDTYNDLDMILFNILIDPTLRKLEQKIKTSSEKIYVVFLL